MSVDLTKALQVSVAGMKAQNTRIKVIAENIANADSTGETPGDLPYRRQTVTFKNALDREMGVETVRVSKIGVDESEFKREYNPSHPSADADGYVLMPNVNSLIETTDLREAQRTYEANLSVIQNVRQMLTRTVQVLRG